MENIEELKKSIEQQQKDIDRLKNVVKLQQRQLLELYKKFSAVNERNRVATEKIRFIELKLKG